MALRTVAGSVVVDGQLVTASTSYELLEDPEPRSDVIGANFGGGDERLFQGRPRVARIFYRGDTLPQNLPAQDDFRRAYQQGIRVFVISWKTTRDDQVAGMLASAPDDVTIYGCYFHEPEDNITGGARAALSRAVHAVRRVARRVARRAPSERAASMTLAAWRTVTRRHAEVMRPFGARPTVILMAFTLAPGSGRDVSDYFMGGDVDYLMFDFYMNPAKGKDNPEQKIDQMVAAARAGGFRGGTGIGEHGVPHSVNEDTAVALIRRSRAKVLATPEVVVACFWSADTFTFTTRTANAWFDGR